DVDVVAEEEGRDTGQPFVSRQPRHQAALLAYGENRPNLVAAPLGDDGVAVERRRIGEQTPGFVLQRVELGRIEDVLEHEVTATFEMLDLLARQGRVRVPCAVDDGILPREQLGLRSASRWINVLH